MGNWDKCWRNKSVEGEEREKMEEKWWQRK
jgi:hypothetical protein